VVLIGSIPLNIINFNIYFIHCILYRSSPDLDTVFLSENFIKEVVCLIFQSDLSYR